MSTAIILCSSDRSFITLEAERAEFQMGDRTVLLGQFFDTFTTSRLANRNDHCVLTPHIAWVSLFLASFANVLQCGTIELENLFSHNVTLVVSYTVNIVNVDDKLLIGHFVANGNRDTLEDHTGLTLGIFDDGILGFHFLFSLRSIVLLCVNYTKKLFLVNPLLCGGYLMIATIPKVSTFGTHDPHIPLIVGIGNNLSYNLFLESLEHNLITNFKHSFLSFFLLYLLYRHYTTAFLSLQEKSRDFIVKRF